MFNYTFADLGFDGIQNVAEIKIDPETKRILSVEVPKKNAPVYKEYLIPAVMKFLQRQEVRHREAGFVAALAYFMDGSIQFACNQSGGMQFAVTGGVYGPEQYKSEASLERCSNNFDFVSRTFLPRRPEGLMLFQEIPGDGDAYRFRIVHDSPWDVVTDADEKKVAGGKTRRKAALLESAMDYLETYHDKEQFSDAEIREIMAVFDLVAALDPDGRHVGREDERALGIGSFPMGRKGKVVKTDILKFPGNGG